MLPPLLCASYSWHIRRSPKAGDSLEFQVVVSQVILAKSRTDLTLDMASFTPVLKKSLLVVPLKGHTFGIADEEGSQRSDWKTKVLHYYRCFWTKQEGNGKTSVVAWDCFDVEFRYGSWVKHSVSFKNDEIDKLVEYALDQKESYVYTKNKDRVASISYFKELENAVVFSSMSEECGSSIKLTLAEVMELDSAMDIANKVKKFRKLEKGKQEGVEPTLIIELMTWAAAHALWEIFSNKIKAECGGCRVIATLADDGRLNDTDEIGEHTCDKYTGSNLLENKEWVDKVLSDPSTDVTIKTVIRMLFKLLDFQQDEQAYILRTHFPDIRFNDLTRGHIASLCDGHGGWRAAFIKSMVDMDLQAKKDLEKKKRKLAIKDGMEALTKRLRQDAATSEGSAPTE